ncbi:type I secretion outer membrane, TolC family protein [Sphingomonas sp. S17]|uniref:TolC family outer membrane protein n=1 Tax=Sphingomonadales TaxID=204457 RepID=UPI00020A296D|nr:MULTISPECIES: TolC family outer membrane protein [Sphingomonadaceae]AVA15014.1 channel protein TolC [Sphingopyxis sp. MG]EGI54309.1 type I secretion outer membrane, TolC family protein [Sphingomonas sp. S17]
MIRKRAIPFPLLAFLLASVAMPAQATTLEEAIAAAMNHAPEIEAARADADAADARIKEARGQGLPSATLSGTIGYGRLDPQGYFGLPAANVTPRTAQLTIEQPLFMGGRVSAGIAQAKAGSEAAHAGESMTRSQIVVATVQAYGDVLTTHRMVALYEQMVGQMEEIQRQARLRFKAGESPSTDVAQATARLAEAQAALEAARGIAVSADARFTNLTGLAPQDLQPLPANPAMPGSLDEALDIARANNPALAQAEAALEAARAGARGARAERLPTVGAFAEGSTIRDQFFPDYRADGATVGVRARWQLFSGGRVSAKITESDSAVRAADARVRAARSAVDEQTISAFQGVRSAMLVETAAGQQALAAAQARDSVRHEVRVGMKPQIDLLDAEREATAAAVSETRAQGDRIVAAYRLLALLGR